MVDLWADANEVTMPSSRPEKPTDNSFKGPLRNECLNVQWFDDLTDAKMKLKYRLNNRVAQGKNVNYKRRHIEPTSELAIAGRRSVHLPR